MTPGTLCFALIGAASIQISWSAGAVVHPLLGFVYLAGGVWILGSCFFETDIDMVRSGTVSSILLMMAGMAGALDCALHADLVTRCVLLFSLCLVATISVLTLWSKRRQDHLNS